uniref:Apple domain-containing protein n=1 Tax=Eutreptiella gymnastica TaxID=73025 RepID=A0A7S1JI57_9EUGL
MYVGFVFPEGAHPNVYQLGSAADIYIVAGSGWPDTTMVNYSVVPDVEDPSDPLRVLPGYDGLYQPNITGQASLDYTLPHRPRVRRLLSGNYARANPGAWINLTVTDVTNPWDCLTNQTFCVTFGYFSKCIEIERPITNCPVFEKLLVEFFDSHYWNPSATLKLSFNITQDPLYSKSKYKVKITFPNNQGYDIHGAYVHSAPIGLLVPALGDQPTLRAMFDWTPATIHTEPVPPAIEFYLNNHSNQDPVEGQVMAEDYVFFEIANISLPLNCWEEHSSWKLEVGPWAIESLEDHEITGCPNITELDVTFWPPYQSTALSVATFSFFVDFHPLPVEPVTITMPYYTGSGKTFTVRSSQHDVYRFQVDGEANPPLTLHKGLTYRFDVGLCEVCTDHFFAIYVQDAGTGAPGMYLQHQLQSGTDLPHQSIPILYNGVPLTLGTNVKAGIIEWTIPEHFIPSGLYYVNPSKPWMNGTINIVERPRAVELTATSRITENQTQPLGDPYHGYGEMFKGRVDRYWIARDEPYISVQNSTEGVASTWSYENFHIVDGDRWGNGPGDRQRIPTGRMSFQLQDVKLPDDCTDLGNLTLRFGPWYVIENPPSDIIKCPRIEKLDVSFSTHVIGEKAVKATFRVHLFDAPLYPADIKILFPPSNDLRLRDDARLNVAFGDWKPSQLRCVYDRYTDYFCVGRDELGTFPAFNLENCRDYCDAREDCTSFEWMGWHNGTGGGGCHISTSCNYGRSQHLAGSRQTLYTKRSHQCSGRHIRQVNNYEDIEVSIMENFESGTPVWPNTTSLDGSWGNHTEIEVYGIDMPIHCTQLGNFSLKIGKWRVEYNPTHDMLFCPNMTDLDVQFFPTANQSASTDAYVYFNVTDYVDPRWIIVSVPQAVDTTYAYFGSAMEDNSQPGWELDQNDFTNTHTDDWPTMRIGVRNGRRIAPGVHYIVIKNVTLPRGNCSDLGMWRVQIGDSLSLQANPVSDVVENCVVLDQLDLHFLPDAEQGQIVDMVVSFDVEETSLRYIPGDSDEIVVKTSTDSGVQFTSDSRFKDVMGGSWIPAPGNPLLSQVYFSQKFTGGGMIPFHSRTQFTITNVQMPTTCYTTGWWEVSIGIWSLRMVPINDTSVAHCPKIEDLEVRYYPNTPGTESADAQIYFNVKDIRLRPGTLKLNFPGDSGIHMWSYTRLDGPGDWTAVGAPVISPTHGTLWHPGEGEVSYTQTFIGTPLEPGNHSFTVRGVSIPKNNCSDLGYYKLGVGKWMSTWTNPEWDLLACPGLISPINVTLVPFDLPRNFEKANYSFGFSVPSCDFNEIEIQFPPGFEMTGGGGVAEVVSSQGLGLATAEYAVMAPNVFQIRNITSTCDPIREPFPSMQGFCFPKRPCKTGQHLPFNYELAAAVEHCEAICEASPDCLGFTHWPNHGKCVMYQKSTTYNPALIHDACDSDVSLQAGNAADTAFTSVMLAVTGTTDAATAAMYNTRCYLKPADIAVHGIFPNFIKLEMANVVLGNSCDEGTFVISTRTCTYMDRSNGAAEPIRTCLDLPTNGAGVLHTTEAMPKGCDLCNACKYEYTANNGEECYSCFENGIKFSRCQLDVGASCRIGAETTTSTPELW